MSARRMFLFATALGPCAEPQPLTSLVGADAPAAAPQPAAEAPRELPRQQTQTARTFMRDHAKEAHELRHAVIAGRFDLIHRTAAVIASNAGSENLRPDEVSHVTAVRRAASAALGSIMATCSTCHRRLDVEPR